MIERLKKTQLPRPIKFLKFLTPARIQKCLTELQHVLAF